MYATRIAAIKVLHPAPSSTAQSTSSRSIPARFVLRVHFPPQPRRARHALRPERSSARPKSRSRAPAAARACPWSASPASMSTVNSSSSLSTSPATSRATACTSRTSGSTISSAAPSSPSRPIARHQVDCKPVPEGLPAGRPRRLSGRLHGPRFPQPARRPHGLRRPALPAVARARRGRRRRHAARAVRRARRRAPYTQDRMAREAFLETATQRRSLRRLVRLVDYDIHDGRSGGTFLDVRVNDSAPGHARGRLPRLGRRRRRHHRDLRDRAPASPTTWPMGHTLCARRGTPAGRTIFDPDAAELPAGATEIFVQNPGGLVSPSTDWKNKWVLIHRDPPTPGEPPRRHLVFVTDVEEARRQPPDRAPPWRRCPCYGCRGRTSTPYRGASRWDPAPPCTATSCPRPPASAFTELLRDPRWRRGHAPGDRARGRAAGRGHGGAAMTFYTASWPPRRVASAASATTCAPPRPRSGSPGSPATILTSDNLENWTWRRNLLSSNRLDEHYTLDERHLAPRHRLPARHRRQGLRPLRLCQRRRCHHSLRRRRVRADARRRPELPRRLPHRPRHRQQRGRRRDPGTSSIPHQGARHL